MTTRRALIAALALTTVTGVPAYAQPGQPEQPEQVDGPDETNGADERPWATGTTEKQRDTALELYRRGNGFFEREQYGLAAKEYEKALASWSHPAIHYNLGVCLVELGGRLPEALDHFEKGLAFGAAPLGAAGDQLLKDGLRLKKLLKKRVETTLRVRSSQDGAKITLDGKLLFVGPGEQAVKLMPGTFTVEATKPGHDPQTETVELEAGSDTVINLQATPIEVDYVRRWPRWIPWSVAGAGLALSTTALILDRSAQSSFDSFRDAIADCGGCEPTADIQSKRDSGDTKRVVAIVTGSVGVAAMIGGAVLVYLNQPRAETRRPTARPEVAPVVGQNTVGITGRWTF